MTNIQNGDWLEFPKAKKYNPEKIGEWILIEEKLDGERLALWKGHAYGRHISSVTFRRENKWESMPLHIVERRVDGRYAKRERCQLTTTPPNRRIAPCAN